MKLSNKGLNFFVCIYSLKVFGAPIGISYDSLNDLIKRKLVFPFYLFPKSDWQKGAATS